MRLGDLFESLEHEPKEHTLANLDGVFTGLGYRRVAGSGHPHEAHSWQHPDYNPEGVSRIMKIPQLLYDNGFRHHEDNETLGKTYVHPNGMKVDADFGMDRYSTKPSWAGRPR